MSWQTAVAAAVLFIACAFSYHEGGLRSAKALSDYRATNAINLAKALKTQADEQAEREMAYAKELDQLKTDALTYPTVAVRLCPLPNSVVPGPSPGHVLPAAGGVLPPVVVQDRAPPDLGPALFSLADEADSIVAKCRAE